MKTVRPIIEEQFGFAEIQVVSFADLYAGKLDAARDQQHPRDLFDVQHLLANEGIDKTLCLNNIRQAFEREFVGMTVSETSLSRLLETREQLVTEICSRLDETSKLFLKSFHALKLDWELISQSTIRNLPAIRCN